MISTVTFDSVYTKEGAKNGKAWKRWDFKAGDTRYSTFSQVVADKISTGQSVTIEYDEVQSGDYTNRTITDVAAGNTQTGFVPVEGPNGVSGQHTRSQAPSGRDFQAEAAGKTRCALVSQLLPAMFNALNPEAQNKESAEVLLAWAFGYVFPDEMPF